MADRLEGRHRGPQETSEIHIGRSHGQDKAPVYVMHGTRDIIMDVNGARRFVEALTTDDVTVDIYDGAGSMHGSYDCLAVASAPLTDWFLHRL